MTIKGSPAACLVCDTPIRQPEKGRRLTCSLVCQRRRYAASAPKPARVVTCRVCTAEFEVQGRGARQRCGDCATRGRMHPQRECAFCGARFWPTTRDRTVCGAVCAAKTRATGMRAEAVARGGEPGRRGRRNTAERSAPGLTAHQRRQLLHAWKRQGRCCSYCPNRVAAVDHVVPLSRGGTNHVGNLAPICQSCNSSKGQHLIMEWRLKRAWPTSRTNRAETREGQPRETAPA